MYEMYIIRYGILQSLEPAKTRRCFTRGCPETALNCLEVNPGHNESSDLQRPVGAIAPSVTFDKL